MSLLVHSVIYYKLGKNIITDEQWDELSKELVSVQNKYPLISARVESYLKDFKNWDGGSGYQLPLDDGWANRKAKYLLSIQGG